MIASIVLSSKTNHDDTHQIVEHDLLVHIADDLLFGNLIHCNGVSALFGWIEANPNRINLFDVRIFCVFEFRTILR